MSDDAAVEGTVDEQLLRSLCAEAHALVGKLRGPVSRLAVQAGDHRVEIEWDTTSAAQGPREGAGPAATGAAADTAATGEAAEAGDRHAIHAPLLGTFYRSPEPGAPPFVEEGDVIEPDQVVGIVEAMKILNRIQADRGGRVVKILVADGEMVEFGQELMVLEPFEAGPAG